MCFRMAPTWWRRSISAATCRSTSWWRSRARPWPALNTPRTLVFTDVFGATPCNVAQKLVDGVHTRLVAGVNLPMLLRAMTYRREPIEALVARAMAGGVQGVMQVATAAPQNQARKKHDQDPGDHQQ